MTAIGGHETATQGQGALRLRIKGAPPREDNLNRRAFAPQVELSAPFVYKQVIEAPYNVPRTTAFTRPLFDMLASQKYRDVYRCG